jgi:predicted ATPase
MTGRPSVHLLGPFGLEVDGVEVRVPQPMRRALVARLALASGATVSLQELAADLWRQPPAGAAGVIRAHVSRLRSEALGAHLGGGHGGYALAADLDLAEADDAMEQVEQAVHALRLWRGRPGEGLPDSPVRDLVEQTAARLRARLLHVIARHVLDEPADAASLLPILERAGTDDPDDPLLASAVRAASLAALRDGGGSARARHHGLPLRTDAYIGRRRLMGDIRTALLASRLVTLVGPGGAGKTRAAVEAARAEPGSKEVRVLDLADVHDRGGLLRAAAAVVDAEDASAAAVEERLDRGAVGLLLIDNAEHLRADSAKLVRGILEHCAGVGLLVTSREPLGLHGEHLIAVGPMLADELSDAIELLRTRLRQSGAGCVPDSALEEIVVGLDALPLALELAAAQAGSVRTDELVPAALRLRSASDGGRHADLAALVGWSIDLLSPGERELLGQLAGFPGPVPTEAVQAVCEPGGAEAGRALSALVAKSLVAVTRPAHGPVGFTLLATIRGVVPVSTTVDDAWRDRLRQWSLVRLQTLAPRLADGGARDAGAELDLLEPVLTSVRAAAMTGGDRATAVALCAVLGQHWFRRGTLRDGVAAVEAALALPGPPVPAEPGAGIALGLMRYQLADLDQAAAALDKAAVAAADGSDEHAVATAFRAYVGHLRREPVAALQHWEEELASAAVSPTARRLVDLPRGQLLRSLGRPDEALRLLETVGRSAGSAGDAWVLGMAAFIGAKILLDARRPQDAVELLLPVVRRSTTELEPVTALVGLAILAPAATATGAPELGAELVGAVEALGHRYGFDPEANEPQDFERYRWLVRTALPADVWARAVERGGALDLESAVWSAEDGLRFPRRRATRGTRHG